MMNDIGFFEHKPFMSVELLNLIRSYRVICYNDDSVYRMLKEKWNIVSCGNTAFNDDLESDVAVGRMLDDDVFVQKVVPDKEGTQALFFYMTRQMSAKVERAGLSMCLPSFELQDRLGNRLGLPDICKTLGLTSHRTLVFNRTRGDSDKWFEECQQSLGTPFIVQGGVGASGSDTFLVDSRKTLEEALRRIDGGFKASKYLKKNIPISTHVCILENETLIRGPYIQLIGIPELAHTPFQFSGNDTNQSLLTPSLIRRARQASMSIAEYAKGVGYRGILGVDFLWDAEEDILYTQELNTRLVGLTRLLTGMQKDQAIIPDLVRHIECFAHVERTEKCLVLSTGELDLSKHDYAQLIIRNNTTKDAVMTHAIHPGIYQIQDGALTYVRRSLFMEDVEPGELLIASSAYVGARLTPGEAIVRVLMKEGVLSHGEYKVKPPIAKVIQVIRKYALTKEE